MGVGVGARVCACVYVCVGRMCVRTCVRVCTYGYVHVRACALPGILRRRLHTRRRATSFSSTVCAEACVRPSRPRFGLALNVTAPPTATCIALLSWLGLTGLAFGRCRCPGGSTYEGLDGTYRLSGDNIEDDQGDIIRTTRHAHHLPRAAWPPPPRWHARLAFNCPRVPAHHCRRRHHHHCRDGVRAWRLPDAAHSVAPLERRYRCCAKTPRRPYVG